MPTPAEAPGRRPFPCRCAAAMLMAVAVTLAAGCGSTPPPVAPPRTQPPGNIMTRPPKTTPVPAPRARRGPQLPPLSGTLEVPIRRQWKYIVVHHSGSDRGSMRGIDEWHKQRGWEGVGYDFVIGNDNGSPDGTVEVTFRWTRQMQGAHAGVEEYNQYGIGICLVGNFEESYPTNAQMTSLVLLIDYLQDRCHIPTYNILMHRQIKSTECPGAKFPYYRMMAMLSH